MLLAIIFVSLGIRAPAVIKADDIGVLQDMEVVTTVSGVAIQIIRDPVIAEIRDISVIQEQDYTFTLTYTVHNPASYDVTISEIYLNKASDWLLVDYYEDFKSKKVGSCEFGVLMLGLSITNDKNILNLDQVIGAGGETTISCKIKIPAQDKPLQLELFTLLLLLSPVELIELVDGVEELEEVEDLKDLEVEGLEEVELEETGDLIEPKEVKDLGESEQVEDKGVEEPEDIELVEDIEVEIEEVDKVEETEYSVGNELPVEGQVEETETPGLINHNQDDGELNLDNHN